MKKNSRKQSSRVSARRSSIALASAFGLSLIFSLSSQSVFAGVNPPFNNPPSGNVTPTFTSIESTGDAIVGQILRIGNYIAPKSGGTLNIQANTTNATGKLNIGDGLDIYSILPGAITDLVAHFAINTIDLYRPIVVSVGQPYSAPESYTKAGTGFYLVKAIGNALLGNVNAQKLAVGSPTSKITNLADGEAYFMGKVTTESGISVKDQSAETTSITKDGVHVLDAQGSNLGALTGKGTMYANRLIVGPPGAGNLDNSSLSLLPQISTVATIDSSGNFRSNGTVTAYGGIGTFYSILGTYQAVQGFDPTKKSFSVGAPSFVSCKTNHVYGRLMSCNLDASANGVATNISISKDTCNVTPTNFSPTTQFGYQALAVCFDPSM